MKRFGILIIALFGVAGCDRDSRYFCISDGPLSDRGCFLCRGDECDPQPAPQRSICATDVDCAVGELCTEVGCVAECEAEYDCPIGTTCSDNGLCLNPLEEQPDPPEPPAFTCQFNFECGDDRICIDGECLITCLDAACPETQQCVAGACRPCTDATCLTNCSEDAECADHEYCNAFQCVPDTRPETFCPENDCQPDRICVRGQCRTPCDTDDECARIDTTIRFCAPVEDQNLCVRSSEVLAECQLNIDCGLGDECVDGACAANPGSP
ncbi:MAG: hypothetical protein ACN4G0_20180 [Polyangiales bacterium]